MTDPDGPPPIDPIPTLITLTKNFAGTVRAAEVEVSNHKWTTPAWQEACGNYDMARARYEGMRRLLGTVLLAAQGRTDSYAEAVAAARKALGDDIAFKRPSVMWMDEVTPMWDTSTEPEVAG